MKKILKFILKIAVAGAIVVALIFGISALTAPKTTTMDLVNVSTDKNIQTRLASSHDGIYAYTTSNNNNYTGQNKVNATVVDGLNKVGEILELYYDHYINLTCFENKANNSLKSNLTKQIKDLSKKIDETTRYFNEVKSASATNYIEVNSRITKMFNAYVLQTEQLFVVCSDLQDYVYAVNYKTNSATSKTEAVLQMALDYSKAVFDNCISNNVTGTKSYSLLTESAETSLKTVYGKVMAMSDLDQNFDTETGFIATYFEIEKKFLNEYYALSNTSKSGYVNSKDNFLEKPEVESTELEIARASEQVIAMQYLQKYLNLTSF